MSSDQPIAVDSVQLDADDLAVLASAKKKKVGVYRRIITEFFRRGYSEGVQEVRFEREDIPKLCDELGLKVPKNLGDVVYTYRYRQLMPAEIAKTAPNGLEWVITSGGAGATSYKFALARKIELRPRGGKALIKIPDATPEIIERYRLSDEQALLAMIRYNRLIDVFLGIAAYSLQNHLRTQVADMGQIEIDELYVGVDGRGVHYIVPMQAKRGKDRLAIIQTLQDVAFCRARYPELVCRAISAQFVADKVIAMFELTEENEEVRIVDEQHYKLVPADEISASDLQTYRSRSTV